MTTALTAPRPAAKHFTTEELRARLTIIMNQLERAFGSIYAALDTGLLFLLPVGVRPPVHRVPLGEE